MDFTWTGNTEMHWLVTDNLKKKMSVPGVSQAAILFLSRRCDVRMYRSCAGVVTRGLPLRGRSSVHPVSL